MCTVGRDQFPRSIKLTSSLLLLLLLLMFNTAVTAMGATASPQTLIDPGTGLQLEVVYHATTLSGL